MSSTGILPFNFPDAPDLQVWNNAAFDDDDYGLDESRPNLSTTTSWWTHSMDSHSSKENLSPVRENSPAPPRKPGVLLPLAKRDTNNGNDAVVGQEKEGEEEGKIDREIEEIEKEIARLSSRLHALKLEKAERKIKKTVERRGRIVPAKFMDTKRRGLSLGPAEIFSGSKSRLLKETGGGGGGGILTPASSAKQSRRVSCFWRLQEIDELKVVKERGKSASLSPRSRKPGPKPKQGGAATTGPTKKPAKKEDGLAGLIQPRTLFKDGEKPGKKVVAKPGRVVASRYNISQGAAGAEARKRSLPDDNKEEGNKRRVSRGGQQQQQQRKSDNEGGRVKKRWDVAAPAPAEGTPALADVLPKIRTVRHVSDTPRDSGAAKRVADLVGRRSFFGAGDDRSGETVEVVAAGMDSVCQVLRFGEEDD